MSFAVRLSGLKRRFGKVTALDGVSLEVEEGTIYGFLGRNGAGKSTTLKTLLGVIRPDAGTVELFGQPVKKVTPALKQQIGYLAQEQRFYAWMKPQQLAAFVAPFYPQWEDAEFTRLLTVLDVPKDRRSGDMSGGNRTKLALALALAAKPKLLLLDEPTAGLDPVVRREFLDQLAREVQTRGVTVLYSSHLVDEVEALAQRVGIIEGGKMRFEGSPERLRQTVRRVKPVFVAPALVEPPQQGFVLGAPAPAPPPPPPIPAPRPSAPSMSPPLPGLTSLVDNVYRAEPEAWAAFAATPSYQVEELGLEEIFLAVARAR
jgi:ABC-2 type transport system ATP-binding protein